MKNPLFILGVIVCTSFVALFATLHLNESATQQASEVNFRPHIMINDQIYWLSAYPCDESISQRALTHIGQVEEKVTTHPEHNFQAYGITEGTQVYFDDRFPYIIYLKTDSLFDCFVTADMSMEYVYFAGSTYVSLSSLCSWDYERYKDYYVPIYGDEIVRSKLPASAQLVGETVFVGYHMSVTDELETNAFREPVPVYKDNTDLNMLYVGNNNMMYVPLER